MKLLAHIVVLPIMAGCIAVPVNLPDDEPFSEKVVHVLESGVADRTYVESSLGKPSYSFVNGQYWVYEREHDAETEWFVCAAIPAGFGGYGSCDVVGTGDTEQHLLLIRFDAGGIVQDHQIGPIGELGLVRSPSSQGKQFLLVTYAPEWDEVTSPEYCVAYFIPLYQSSEAERSWALLNQAGISVGSVHRGRDAEQATRLLLSPGHQTLLAISETVDPGLAIQVSFSCGGGEVSYITTTNTASARAELDIASIEVGRAALDGRVIKLANDVPN